MLFWIFVIIFLIGIGLTIIGNINWSYEKHRFLEHHDYDFFRAGLTTAEISGVIAVIMLLIIVGSHIGTKAEIAVNKARYEALVYKVESEACRDEFGLLNKSVVDEVQDWNENIAFYKTIQNDFWFGIFYPNIYDNFEVIDYTKFEKKEE